MLNLPCRTPGPEGGPLVDEPLSRRALDELSQLGCTRALTCGGSRNGSNRTTFVRRRKAVKVLHAVSVLILLLLSPMQVWSISFVLLA